MTLEDPRPDLTVAIIKPDAVRRGIVGTILQRAEQEGLVPIDMHMETMTFELAREFYAEHREHDYFDQLVTFMGSGPSVYVLFHRQRVARLQARSVTARSLWRALLGATNPLLADLGTLRRLYGTGGPANVGHGSDSAKAVEREMQLLGLSVPS